MSDDPHPEQSNCLDDGNNGLLRPEAHDLVEVDKVLIWEISNSAAYKIKRECSRDGCDAGFYGVSIVGKKITTVQDLKIITYDIYESYYDNPRSIPYRVIQRLIAIPDIDTGVRERIAAELSNAAQRGCNDAKAGQEKRPKQELLDAVLPDDL